MCLILPILYYSDFYFCFVLVVFPYYQEWTLGSHLHQFVLEANQLLRFHRFLLQEWTMLWSTQELGDYPCVFSVHLFFLVSHMVLPGVDHAFKHTRTWWLSLCLFCPFIFLSFTYGANWIFCLDCKFFESGYGIRNIQTRFSEIWACVPYRVSTTEHTVRFSSSYLDVPLHESFIV